MRTASHWIALLILAVAVGSYGALVWAPAPTPPTLDHLID